MPFLTRPVFLFSFFSKKVEKVSTYEYLTNVQDKWRLVTNNRPPMYLRFHTNILAAIESSTGAVTVEKK